MRFLMLSLVGVGLLLSLTTASDAGAVTFYDGTFNEADWISDAFENANGGTAAATQVAVGGNPGAYLRIVNIVNPGAATSAVWGLYIKPTASYTPSLQGAIINGSLSIDSFMFEGFGAGQAVRTLLRQNGKYFIRVSG